jgi:RNA polymerase sigma factor (sigma-70 family)
LSDLHLLDEIELDPQSGIRKVQDQYGANLFARLSRFAEAHRHGDAEVKDVYQDALIRLIDPEERAACRAAGGSILPWLTKWGYWRLSDRARERRRLIGDGKKEPVEGRPPEQVEEVDPSAAARTVAEVVRGMSPKDQDLLRMHYEERLTYKDIATRLEIKEGAAKKRLHDARIRIARLLEEQGIRFE